jgi:5-methylthioribose kinase
MKIADQIDQPPLAKWDCDYAHKVLLNYPCYHERLGNVLDLKIREIGDGNLNFIFVVEGDKGTIVMKIAPPFVRVLPEWPMSTKRAFYEYSALSEEFKVAPEYVPEAYGYHPEESLIVMQFISPHIILRKGMMDGIEYPKLAEHVGDFFAKTLFFTSDLFLKNRDKRDLVVKFFTNELLFITEQLFFQEPYMGAKNNKWTNTEEMNNLVAQLQSDMALKLVVAEFHHRFQNDNQALLHADMHSGSIMVTQDSTYIFDPEFAYFGPMGFDIGSYLANVLMSYYGQDGLAADRANYKNWILKHAQETWNSFQQRFITIWNANHAGDLYLYFKDVDEDSKKLMQADYFKKLFADTVPTLALKLFEEMLALLMLLI